MHTQNMREEQARAVLRVREGETARAVALDIGRTHQTVLKWAETWTADDAIATMDTLARQRMAVLQLDWVNALSDAPKDKVHARDLRDLRTSLAAKVSMSPPGDHTKPTKAPPKPPKAPPFAQ